MASVHSGTGDRRLDSWKEIALFFGRDERTVRRWEKERGLPVHRIPGGNRGSVFAFESELAAWLQARDHLGVDDSASVSQPSEPSANAVAAKPGFPSQPAQAVRRRTLAWITALFAISCAVILIGGLWYFRINSARSHAAAGIGPAPSPARREAEELYLQGRFYWNKRTPEGLTQSVDYFTRSTQRDPTFALGYCGLADAYNLLREYTSMPSSEAFPLALASAKKAVELDPSLPEAHRALAFVEFNWNWDSSTADREYRRAIELRPSDPQSHHWYATMLLELARHQQAIAEIERARELDPSSESIAADRGFILYGAGRLQEGFAALQALEKAGHDFISPHRYLASMYFETRQYPQSFAETRIVNQLAGNGSSEVDRDEEHFRRGGERGLLQAVLARRLDDFAKGRGEAFSVAVSYANLGQTRESIEYLDRAFQRHEYVLISVRNHPAFRSFAGVAEYQDLLRRLGLSSETK
jgi:tetratricopeptide (TPR) repeat protein